MLPDTDLPDWFAAAEVDRLMNCTGGCCCSCGCALGGDDMGVVGGGSGGGEKRVDLFEIGDADVL